MKLGSRRRFFRVPKSKQVFLALALLLIIISVTLVFMQNTNGLDEDLVASENQVDVGSIAIGDGLEPERETGPEAIDEAIISPVFAAPVWIVALLTILFFVSVISTSVTINLVRWRRQIESTGAMVPEKWAKYLSNVVESSDEVATKQLEILDGSIKSSLHTQAEVERIISEISDVQQTLNAFQRALDIRDQEIARLREGYDVALLKRYFTNLIGIMEKADELSKREDTGQKQMRNISLLMLDLLELGGVEQFSPEIHKDFADLGEQVVRHNVSVETDNPEMHGKIAEVLANGFKLVSGINIEVLKSAAVKVFVYRGDGEK